MQMTEVDRQAEGKKKKRRNHRPLACLSLTLSFALHVFSSVQEKYVSGVGVGVELTSQNAYPVAKNEGKAVLPALGENFFFFCFHKFFIS